MEKPGSQCLNFGSATSVASTQRDAAELFCLHPGNASADGLDTSPRLQSKPSEKSRRLGEDASQSPRRCTAARIAHFEWVEVAGTKMQQTERGRGRRSCGGD